MSRCEESARVAGTCLVLGVLLLGLAACRQAVDPPVSPDPDTWSCEPMGVADPYAGTGSAAALGTVSITWSDRPSETCDTGIAGRGAAGRVLVGEPLDLTGSGPLTMVSSGSLAFSTSAPSRLVFTGGPDCCASYVMRLDRFRQEVVIEDDAGRELARGVEVGERTDGFLVLRDARGWEVWRSLDPCPPQWSRLPR